MGRQQVAQLVSRIDPQTNRVVATIAASDGVADPWLSAATRSGPADCGPRGWRGSYGSTRGPTGWRRPCPSESQPSGLAVTDHAVWVTSLVGGTLWRIDPQSNTVTATIRLGAQAGPGGGR